MGDQEYALDNAIDDAVDLLGVLREFIEEFAIEDLPPETLARIEKCSQKLTDHIAY